MLQYFKAVVNADDIMRTLQSIKQQFGHFCIFIVTAEKDLTAIWAFRFNPFCYIFASSEKRL